jgi:hypothetical protein
VETGHISTSVQQLHVSVATETVMIASSRRSYRTISPRYEINSSLAFRL